MLRFPGAAAAPRSLLLDSQSAEYLLVGILHISQVPAEPVLVQLLVGILIPQTAGIRGNLIRQNNLAVEAAKLNLEVNQINVQAVEILDKLLVHFKCILGDVVNLLLGGQAKCQRIVAVDEGIAQVVVLVAKLQGGALELDAFLHAHLLCKASCGIVADDSILLSFAIKDKAVESPPP